MTKYFIEKMCFYVLFLFPFSYRWALRWVFIKYSRDIHMYRLCIGYVSVMCRLCIGKASEHLSASGLFEVARYFYWNGVKIVRTK